MVNNTISSHYALAANILTNNEATIADSGFTSHYVGVNAQCTHIKKCAPRLTIKLPNNTLMEPTHTALLDMPHIPLVVRYCHLFPDMRNKALLSISQFCNNGYRATITTHKLIMEYQTDPSKIFDG